MRDSARSVAAPPYFDVLFARLEANEPATATAFGRHVHWGYWPDPASADGSAADYAAAAERLCRRVCDAAEVRDGLRVLDVGCGYGGTIASLNERFKGLTLVGVNIDRRQLERARQTVQPANGNVISFVHGDACRLDLAAGSFDVVLAVECIFHFADRAAFFRGASAALVEGGMLALSDFVPPETAVPVLAAYDPTRDEAMRTTYGQIDVRCPLGRYVQLGRDTCLALHSATNISRQTLPTYPFLRKHLRNWPEPTHARLYDRATARLEMACHTGLLDYHILAFRKQTAAALAVA
jgi:cyclopropane fatty-acyl-phospholipid synthase-like methyltransferase